MIEDKISRKTISGQIKAMDLSDADFEVMRTFMVNPERFEKDQFKTYTAYLAHNFVDRDGERFSLPVLKSFVKSLPGRALLIGHDWGTPGEGRFYKAHLEKMSVDETVEFAGKVTEKDFKETLTKIEKKDGGLYWLVTDYYILSSDVEKVDKIDSGIMKDMSIGFRSPVLEEIRDEKGENVLWYEYQNAEKREAEALEGSLVFLGAQNGASTRKEFLSIAKAYNPGITEKDIDKIFNQKKDEKIEITNSEEIMDKKSIAYIINGEAKTVELAVDEATAQEIKTLLSEKDKDTEDQVKAAKKEFEPVKTELDSIKTIFGDEYSIDRIKELAGLDDKLTQAKAADVLRLGQLAGVVPKGEAGEKRLALYLKMPLDDLEEMAKDFQKVLDDKNPPSGQLNTDIPGKEKTGKEINKINFVTPIIEN